MAPELHRAVGRVTFLLVALAAAATEVAADDVRPVGVSLAQAAGWVAAALVAARFAPTPNDPRGRPPWWLFLLLVALGGSTFVLEPLRRSWFGEGYPLELQMVAGLRNVGLALAAFSGWVLCLRLAAVVSLFLTLFAVAMTDHPAVLAVLGVYTAAGSVWLMLVYWAGLRGFFVHSDHAVSLEVQPGRERLPWVAVSVAVGLVGCVLALVAVGPTHAAYVLGEWLSTSGGTGGYDPFARGGVNDGDDETKGDNAKSTGMTQTETFLESPLPSLYDLISETHGKPFKAKEQDRAISLNGQEKVRYGKKKPPDNLRPNREFTTARRSPKPNRDPASRAARALFEVSGRTPLHVRVTAYDEFDGAEWKEAPFSGRGVLLEKEPRGYWFQVPQRSPGTIFSCWAEPHQFKMTTSRGSLVPTPPHLTRLRVGRVDQADFFGWAQEGILRMPDRTLPSGVVVDTESRVVDPARLGSATLLADPRSAGVAPAVDPCVAALAREWVGDAEGWDQVEAVTRRLREGYTHDRQAASPEGRRDTLGHFLFEARRGPDYQFATAAAVMLRALGCRTRLVCGFYAAPEHYDPLTRHTPVVKEDLHFWAEVALRSGDWVIVEATPGYDVLGPATPVGERVLAGLLMLGQWAWDNVVALSMLLVTGLALRRWRRELIDAALVAWWRCFPGRDWRECVRGAVGVLERRGRWFGQGRPPSQTGFAWLRQRDELARLAGMAEWAAYAPQLPPPWPEGEARLVCQQALERWALSRWRVARKGDAR